jgi:hypothetical protein
MDSEQISQKCFAIGMTWNIPASKRNQFRKDVKSKLLPQLKDLQSNKKVTMVLSLRHKPLKVQGADNDNSWTDYLLILLPPGIDPIETWFLIDVMIQEVANQIPKGLLRVEVLRPQKMPIFFPRRHLRHVIEYALSNPQAKVDYYIDQYMFSGPVIKCFLEKNAVGSFIGLERIHYLQNNDSLPEWDVIHITGFKWISLGKILWVLYRNRKAFHSIARKTGYESAWDVLKSWDTKRKKFLRVASQDAPCTLLPIRTSKAKKVSTLYSSTNNSNNKIKIRHEKN